MTALYLTRRAELDLIAIEDYSIEQWGERVAGEYLEAIQAAFDLLHVSPRLLRPKDEFADWLCFYRVERHWLICTILAGDIYVLAVRHGAMDLPARLAELEPSLMQEAEILFRRIQDERERP